MVKTFKILKMLFANSILNDNIIYIISNYVGKKWSVNLPQLKHIKVKKGKREKQKYSFHYYYN